MKMNVDAGPKWALLLILAIHLFFFLWGFATITDENMSNYSFGLENHFEGLPMVMSFIIIVLMLVGWFILSYPEIGLH